MTGIEPATTGATIQCSTTELHPPWVPNGARFYSTLCASRKGDRAARAGWTRAFGADGWDWGASEQKVTPLEGPTDLKLPHVFWVQLSAQFSG